MSGKPKSAYMPEELVERINESPYNFSQETREFWMAKLSTTTDATLQKLRSDLEEVEDDIDDIEAQLEEKREERADLEERIEGLEERNEERREAVHEAVRSVMRFVPNKREPDDLQSASDGTGLTPDELSQLVHDIDLGYTAGDSPDSLTDDERDAVDEWLEQHV